VHRAHYLYGYHGAMPPMAPIALVAPMARSTNRSTTTGIRLFDRVDPGRVALNQARTAASTRVTHLTYTAVKR
jgi:hypothetical protein